MKKNFLYLFLLFFFISCSHLPMKPIVFSPLDKINLENSITNFKASLKNNNVFEITNFFENNYRNRKALVVLEKIDFSNITIFSSKVQTPLIKSMISEYPMILSCFKFSP